MNAREKRAVTALTAIFALRMLGLFMLLPVLGLYAAQLPAATPLLIGLALGIYGLTQGMLQIPFGMASDRFGRKRVITIGLLIFFGGSVFAALTDSLFGLIIARALQGAGAVSAAVLALTADLTDETSRTKAMAIIGVSIGAVFLLSLMVATPLQSVVGVSGIFWLSAGLALLAIAVLWWVVPEPTSSSAPLTWSASIRRILFERQLLRLNIGVFFLHLILTAIFVTLPALLHIKSGLVLGRALEDIHASVDTVGGGHATVTQTRLPRPYHRLGIYRWGRTIIIFHHWHGVGEHSGNRRVIVRTMVIFYFLQRPGSHATVVGIADCAAYR